MRGSVWVVVRSILVEAVVVSVDGLLDAHEVSVRARLEALREQAARVAVELGEAELALEHVAITRATLARVTGAGQGPTLEHGVRSAGVSRCAVPSSSLVQVWRIDLTEAHLPTGYRELHRAVALALASGRCGRRIWRPCSGWRSARRRWRAAL